MVGEPRGGEFDGERNAFEDAADLPGGGERVGVVQAGLRGRVGGAVQEQPQCLLVLPFERQRRHVEDTFAPDAERPPAGGEDGQARSGGGELGDEVGGGLHDPLAPVEHQQQTRVREAFTERVDGSAQGVVAQPHRLGDGGDEPAVVPEHGQVGPARSCRVPAGGVPGGAHREPALAHAARARQGDDPVALKQPVERASSAERPTKLVVSSGR